MSERQAAVRLHLTNVAGAGAIQLVKSLLPALERSAVARISEIHLPDRGELANYRALGPDVRPRRYRRRLPNAVSRALECTLLAARFDGSTPLLVLGDIPLRCRGPQTVFVQTPLLAAPSSAHRLPERWKLAVARWLFRLNARHAGAFIVQTSVMKASLTASYPEIADRIHVLAQPVPAWLIDAGLRRRGRHVALDAPLTLVYPAATYRHKNHRLLGDIDAATAATWPVRRLTLTIAPDLSPAPALPWLSCCGFLPPQGMLDLYRDVDALLFLSLDESFGFPLLEAMFVGIPVVCPDLPYARAMCGDGAIYFDPTSTGSLQHALETLHRRLARGWWPDWSAALAKFPADWDAVAAAMLRLALAGTAADPLG